MRLAGIVQKVGLLALIVGIVGFFLPGQFLYSTLLVSLLSTYGDLLFKGVSANPMIIMFVAKAPVIIFALIGLCMVFWGTMKGPTEPDDPAETKITRRSISELVRAHKTGEGNADAGKKSVSEIYDKPKR